MTTSLVAAAPFSRGEPLKILELGSGDGRLAEALLTVFPQATLTALDGSESMRTETSSRRALVGARGPLAAFDVAALAGGARVVVVALTVPFSGLDPLTHPRRRS